MSDVDLKALAERASEAQRAWALAGLERRLNVLQQAGQALSNRREELYDGLRKDGLSTVLAEYYGAWIIHQGQPDLLARYAKDMVELKRSRGGSSELLLRRPDGVVLLITPANSPTINGATLFSLLLPGNAVVARGPSNDTGLRLLADSIIGDALQDGGFDPALCSVATGKSRWVLGELLPHQAVRTVLFFGNSVAGRSVAEEGLKHQTKVVLELDGSDHMAVWKDAEVPRAVDSAMHAFDFSTQPCPIPKHLLVHDHAFSDFRQQLLSRVSELRTVVQDPEGGVLVPVARPEGFFAALEELKAIGEVHCGGFRMDANGEPDEEGMFVSPTVVSIDAAACLDRPLKAFHEEIFFPLIPVVRFRGSDAEIEGQMLQLMQQSPFGLRASLWAQDAAVLGRFASALSDVGLLIFNDDHAQCPDYASPWGGPRRSGGPNGESHLFWEKTSHLQALACSTLDDEQICALAESLGCAGLLDLPRPTRRQPVSETNAPVHLEVREAVGTLTLCRPARHNAVNGQMVEELRDAVEQLRATRGLRCLVIRGDGDSFCSGADLQELKAFDPQQTRQFMLDATWCFRQLEQLPVPVIAAVRGHCLGGGFELALHCDEIIADTSARFRFPETGLGLVTTAGSVSRLMRCVGSMRARRVLYGGRALPAETAADWGLVTQLVETTQLDDAVEQRASELASLPAQGIRAMKSLTQGLDGGEQREGWIREVEAFDALVRAKQESSGD